MGMPVLAAEGSLVDPTILLIEFDIPTVRAVVGGFKQAGMQVVWARDSMTGMALSMQLRPDIVLVGLGLPDMNSVTLVDLLVAPGNCGVVVLASTEDEVARITCLEAGADDYLAEPSSVRDMIARARAVHRRVIVRKGLLAEANIEPALVVGPIRINLQHRSVHTFDGERVNLTFAEYTTLETLARANGVAVSRDCLSETALGRPWRAEDRSVDQIVFHLRRKLPVDEDGGVLIQSIRGSGYWMRAPDKPARQLPGFEWSVRDPSLHLAPEHHMAA